MSRIGRLEKALAKARQDTRRVWADAHPDLVEALRAAGDLPTDGYPCMSQIRRLEAGRKAAKSAGITSEN